MSYSVYHTGRNHGLGRAAGPFETEAEAMAEMESCYRLFGPVEVSEDVPPSDAQRTYQAAFLAAREAVRSKAAASRQRKAAREAVIAAHGAEWLDAHGNPRLMLPR